MKITAVPSFANSISPAPGAPPELRSIKMVTNATPEQPLAQPPAQELSIPDNSKTDAVTEDTKPISPQYAELAKRRRALQIKERELATREKALAEKSQGSDSIPLARLKSEPLSVLLESGVTYDQLTQAILANQGNPEIAALKAEVQALKEGVDKRFTDNVTQQEQAVLAEMRKEATGLVATGEEYALVRETGRIPDVMRLIEETYRESGQVLGVKEALQAIETELFKDAEKIASLEKIRNKYIASPPQQLSRPQGMRTLTNKDTASIPLSPKQRALAAFNGTLKRG